MRDTVTSASPTGRAAALLRLRDEARRAVAGEPGVVLLVGETGIGKTQLVRELLKDPPGRPIVLAGGCLSQPSEELVFAPVRDALGPLDQDVPRADPASILPALHDVLAARGGETGCICILENLQWADRWTRLFVESWARRIRDERVLLLVTCRSDEPARDHRLSALLSELGRLDRVIEIRLGALSSEELAEAVSDLLEASEGPYRLEQLMTRSGGNPAIARALLADRLDPDGPLPESLRETLRVRVTSLTLNAQRVLAAVAVGAPADENALLAALALDRDALRDGLRETIGSRFVAGDERGRFRVRHPALREAVAADLLPGERSDLHRRFADHLDGGERSSVPAAAAPERFAAVAHHRAAAGDPVAALAAAVEAAERAERAEDYPVAAEALVVALEVWPDVVDPVAIAGADRIDLLVRCARDRTAAGDRAGADAMVGEALDALDVEDDPARHGALLSHRARTRWSLNDPEAALAAARRAITLLDGGPLDGERVAARAWLARMLMARGGAYHDVVEETDTALADGSRCAQHDLDAELLDTRGVALVALGEIDAGLDSLTRAVDLSRADAQPSRVMGYTGFVNLAEALHSVGRTEEAITVVREGMSRAGPGHVRYRGWLRATLARLAFDAGDWSLAHDCLDRSTPQPNGPLFVTHQLAAAQLAIGEGDLDRAGRDLETVRTLVQTTAEVELIADSARIGGELLARRRALAEARTVVEEALARLPPGADPTRVRPLRLLALRITADEAQRGRDLREPAAEQPAIASADELHASLHDGDPGGGPVAAAQRAHADAELARAEGRSTAGGWRAAAAAWRAVARPYPETICRLREAEALIASDRRDDAAEVLRGVHSAATTLGSRWLVRDARSLADRARLLIDPAAAGDPGADANGDPFDLTERERQVLGLLAQGATNQQIAAALFIAPKTASVHVSRILRKLDARTRTEAAGIAIRLHLTSSPS